MSGSGLSRNDSPTAADFAYSALREAITSGRLRPGHRLREIELSRWLGVSRTPVRQALSRLEVEGLAAAEPRHGLAVARLDADAMRELYEMRMALEGSAAAMAAANASRREIDGLERLVEEEAALADDREILFRHNVIFHEAIYAAAHNRFLNKALSALNDAMALLGPTTLVEAGRRDAALREHRAVVQAIARHDAAAAEAAARDHIAAALNARLAMRREEQAP